MKCCFEKRPLKTFLLAEDRKKAPQVGQKGDQQSESEMAMQDLVREKDSQEDAENQFGAPKQTVLFATVLQADFPTRIGLYCVARTVYSFRFWRRLLKVRMFTFVCLSKSTHLSYGDLSFTQKKHKSPHNSNVRRLNLSKYIFFFQ